MEVKIRLRAILQDGETDEAKAIAAAINAWPGSCNVACTLAGLLLLPLPQEPQ
jgi:hypothetical protein